MGALKVIARCQRQLLSYRRHCRNREMQCGCLLVATALVFILMIIANTANIDDEWTFPAPTLEQRQWLKPDWFLTSEELHKTTGKRTMPLAVEPLALHISRKSNVNSSRSNTQASSMQNDNPLMKAVNFNHAYQSHHERRYTSKRKRTKSSTILLHATNKPNSYHIGKAHVTIYDVSSPISGDYECIRMSIKPKPKICLYPNAVDKFISGSIRSSGVWELHIMRTFQNVLYGNPEIGVIDIGANIGMYSLLAGTMGHRVIAIEPYAGHLQRIHMAVKMNRIEDKIILLQNAISNTREVVSLHQANDNQGAISVNARDSPCKRNECIVKVNAIHMDDILDVNISFHQAVMKIDIEGHELVAFMYSDKLFESVFIPYIFMEWHILRSHFITDVHVSKEKDLVEALLRKLLSKGYTPYSPISFSKLDARYWYGWPDDVWWKHELEEFM